MSDELLSKSIFMCRVNWDLPMAYCGNRYVVRASIVTYGASNGDVHNPGQHSLCILLSKSTALSNSLKKSEENPAVTGAPIDE